MPPAPRRRCSRIVQQQGSRMRAPRPALWWSTDKQFWDYVSSWADNASTPNYLYAALRSSQDDDQENLWGFRCFSTLLGKIESGTNVYVPIAIIGDSDTSGFGATQKSDRK